MYYVYISKIQKSKRDNSILFPKLVLENARKIKEWFAFYSERKEGAFCYVALREPLPDMPATKIISNSVFKMLLKDRKNAYKYLNEEVV